MTPPALPDRVPVPRRLWWAVRPFAGWVFALLGALALFLGWYGVSGTPIPAKQVPYLVSGGLTGVALVVLAAAFFAADDLRGRFADLERMERKVDALYELLTEEEPITAEAEAPGLLAMEGGASYHLPDCRLVAGKEAAHRLRTSEVTARGLAPCRVCDPPRVLAV